MNLHIKQGIWIGILTLFACCQSKTSQNEATDLPKNNVVVSEVAVSEEKEFEESLSIMEEEDKESIMDEEYRPVRFTKDGILEFLTERDLAGEDFENFFNRFVTDEEFQLSRVQFPVEDKIFEYNKVSEYENEWDDPDFDALNGGFIKYIPLTKENWIFITTDYFDEEQERYSQALDRYSRLPKGWYKQDGNILFRNGEYATCAIDYEIIFRKIENLWYMVEYKDYVVYPEDSNGNYMSLYENR